MLFDVPLQSFTFFLFATFLIELTVFDIFHTALFFPIVLHLVTWLFQSTFSTEPMLSSTGEVICKEVDWIIERYSEKGKDLLSFSICITMYVHHLLWPLSWFITSQSILLCKHSKNLILAPESIQPKSKWNGDINTKKKPRDMLNVCHDCHSTSLVWLVSSFSRELMPSFNLNGALYKAAASDPIVPKHVTVQLYRKLFIWLKCMEGVTGSEGVKSPGAVCNQLSGLFCGV